MTRKQYTCPTFEVPVRDSKSKTLTGVLELAQQEDMPVGWSFDWPYIWERVDFSDFTGQSLIKLSVQGGLWGLIKIGLYPCGKKGLTPRIAVVEQIEAHPSRDPKRSKYAKDIPLAPKPYISPVGRWLMWYACQVALDNCVPEDEKPIMVLSSVFDAVDYYIDVIGMDMVDDSFSSGQEDGYGFSFNADQAEDFWAMQRITLGRPKEI